MMMSIQVHISVKVNAKKHYGEPHQHRKSYLHANVRRNRHKPVTVSVKGAYGNGK